MAEATQTLKVVRWDPLGPQGGCVGGEWQVVIWVDACPCPPTDEDEEVP